MPARQKDLDLQASPVILPLLFTPGSCNTGYGALVDVKNHMLWCKQGSTYTQALVDDTIIQPGRAMLTVGKTTVSKVGKPKTTKNE